MIMKIDRSEGNSDEENLEDENENADEGLGDETDEIRSAKDERHISHLESKMDEWGLLPDYIKKGINPYDDFENYLKGKIHKKYKYENFDFEKWLRAKKHK